jgi:glutamate 5-kinase
MGVVGLTEKPSELSSKQALAAFGQVPLMNSYRNNFLKVGINAAQILLTKDDLGSVKRQRNLLNMFEAVFTNYKKSILIINENDAVAVEEIKFGDNDTLSARVAKLLNADLLIILSDIDGLYKEDPNKNPDAELIKSVELIDGSIEKLAKGSGSKVGTGGMITKITAAKIATYAGIDMIITNGNNPQNIKRIIDGENIGTLFHRKTKEIDKLNNADESFSL